MDISQKNLLIATALFGLKEGVDYGTWEKHNWRKDEDGEVDDFAMDNDYHSGPLCERCGEGFCKHCVSDKKKMDEPCVVEIPNYEQPYNFTKLLNAMLDKGLEVKFGRFNRGYTCDIYDRQRAKTISAYRDTKEEVLYDLIVMYLTYSEKGS